MPFITDSSEFATPLSAKVDDPPYTPPVIADNPAFGARLQRTMTLLATSTPTRRNTVKILMYGQSASKQTYWRMLQADLRLRFPYTDLIMECRAIGGFSANLLSRTAQQDMYDFYPDLVIFHDYGAEEDLAKIYGTLRRTTTAEMLLQTNYVTRGGTLEDPYFGDLLPKMAEQFALELGEVRAPWWEYLQQQHLEPDDLLVDGGHTNMRGNLLLADLLLPYLVYRPELPNDNWKNWVKDYHLDDDMQWQDGKLTLEFTGNRVDLIASEHEVNFYPSAQVFIDGKKPSEFKSCYTITRPNETGLEDWPWHGAIIHVAWQSTPMLEDWTATITGTRSDPQGYEFSLHGSKTGADGAGNSWSKFVSNSGRVILEPEDWFLRDSRNMAGGLQWQIGDTLTWSVLPLFHDTYHSPRTDDLTIEYAQTVVQGIDNTRHTLELIAGDNGIPPLAGIRVYCPPLT